MSLLPTVQQDIRPACRINPDQDGFLLRNPAGRTWVHSPDQDTLALQPLPQRAVALVSDGEDVRGDFAEVVTAVALDGRPVVQTRQQLVRVDRRQDGADVGLPTEKHATLALMLAHRAATTAWAQTGSESHVP